MIRLIYNCLKKKVDYNFIFLSFLKSEELFFKIAEFFLKLAESFLKFTVSFFKSAESFFESVELKCYSTPKTQFISKN